MSNTTIGTALAQVADSLSSSDYADKEVFIIIPNITLADKAATEKVSPATSLSPDSYKFSDR